MTIKRIKTKDTTPIAWQPGDMTDLDKQKEHLA